MAVRYVAYIDESGCDGLRLFKPDPRGSSQWFVIGCTLVSIENDHKTVQWVRSILREIGQPSSRDLHFKKLNHHKKNITTEIIGGLPIRNFVVMSNKLNMQNYDNPRIQDGNRNWFYWWLTRCLLERVTRFCRDRNAVIGDPDGQLRIVFSRRGGMQYQDFRDYMIRLRQQSQENALYLNTGDIQWPLIDMNEIDARDHSTRAGLQLADCVAGAFFKAVERNAAGQCVSQYADNIRTRMYRRNGRYLGHGVKPMPGLNHMALDEAQRALFRSFGWRGR